MKTDRELIDEWLATHEVTKCPPAWAWVSGEQQLVRGADAYVAAAAAASRRHSGAP